MKLKYNNHVIEQRDIDGYVNATAMCKANGKKINDWFRTDGYNRYVEALSSVTGKPVSQLVVVKKGNSCNFEQGTWIHPKLAIKLGRWISVEFELWCDQHICTLMETGQTQLRQELPKLPSHVVAENTANSIGNIQDRLGDSNPRLVQFLIDHAISDIMPSKQNTLTGDRLQGVVEIAEEMGLPVTNKNRSQLGKFVKSQCGDLCQEEKRLVNGTSRKVACYPSNATEVRQAIEEFFS